jgi:hypothetical protein
MEGLLYDILRETYVEDLLVRGLELGLCASLLDWAYLKLIESLAQLRLVEVETQELLCLLRFANVVARKAVAQQHAGELLALAITSIVHYDQAAAEAGLELACQVLEGEHWRAATSELNTLAAYLTGCIMREQLCRKKSKLLFLLAPAVDIESFIQDLAL